MKIPLVLVFTIFLAITVQAQNSREKRLEKKAMKRTEFIPDMFPEWKHAGIVSVDSVIIDEKNKTMDLQFNPATTQIPVREEWLKDFESTITSKLGHKFRNYSIKLIARGRELREYIPNAYRERSGFDTKRTTAPYRGIPLVTRLSQPVFEKGLTGQHIALWPSHGL